MAKNIQAERIKGTFDVLSATTAYVEASGIHSNLYSGNTSEAIYYGDGSNLTGLGRTIVSKESNYSALTKDIVWANPTGGTLSIFLPSVSASNNLPVSINHAGSGGTVVADGNGASINDSTGFTLYYGESIEFYSNGIEWRQHN